MNNDTTTKLPKGILESDLQSAHKWTDADYDVPYDDREFELWYTNAFGWCIPTLLISSGRKRGTTDRTYATTLDGKSVRIGKGPHVLRTVRVHVRAARLEALQPFLTLRRDGAARSGEIRDRISTRRARGQEMRAQGRTSWTW